MICEIEGRGPASLGSFVQDPLTDGLGSLMRGFPFAGAAGLSGGRRCCAMEFCAVARNMPVDSH